MGTIKKKKKKQSGECGSSLAMNGMAAAQFETDLQKEGRALKQIKQHKKKKKKKKTKKK